MQQYICIICGLVFEPDNMLNAYALSADINKPNEWQCPNCQVEGAYFTEIQIPSKKFQKSNP